MLSSLLFLMGMVSFALVALWAIQNDAPGNEGGFAGLFGMKSPQEQARRSAPRRHGRNAQLHGAARSPDKSGTI